MRASICLIALCSALGASASPAQTATDDAAPAAPIDAIEAPIRVIERRELHLRPATQPQEMVLRLRVVWIQDTPWTLLRLSAALEEAAGILAQCNINLDEVIVESVVAPPRLRHLDSRTGARMLMRSIAPARPAVVLVDGTRNRPAFEAEAFGRGNTRTRPELADTVWLTAAVSDPGIALAHELVHVLADSGEHSALPGNLMLPDTAPGQTALTGAQCEAIHNNGLARGWLRGRSK